MNNWYPRTASDLDGLPEAPPGSPCHFPIYQDMVMRADAPDRSRSIFVTHIDGKWMKITVTASAHSADT